MKRLPLEPKRAFDRATHRGLHGETFTDSQRRWNLLLAAWAFARLTIWFVLMVAMLAYFAFQHNPLLLSYYHLCEAVAFVTFISLYCNWESAFASFLAARAGLIAADAHHDAEAGRVDLAASSGREPTLRISIENDVVTLSGDLDISTAGSLERALAGATGPLTLDASDLQFLDSGGIGALLTAKERVGDLRIRNPTRAVTRILQLTGLEELCE